MWLKVFMKGFDNGYFISVDSQPINLNNLYFSVPAL